SELQDAVRHLAYRSQRNGERLHLVAAVASVLAQDEDGDSLLKRLNLALARAKQTPAAKRA
ncbi:MAG: GGDEF domain-containing protein, partial [Gammaproteobacteria bacterium]|nr:GGDEF domain-containing protein [Gammaproteobacteria bacterium]